MANKAVICIVKSEEQATDIVDDLKTAGFSNSDISALFPDKKGTRDFAHEQATKAPEGAAPGASAGGLLGGTLGWLAGIGTLAIPGVGPLIAAGPILALLNGAAVGAATGGLTGALVGYGIPEEHARLYEEDIKNGRAVMGVRPRNDEDAEYFENNWRNDYRGEHVYR